jgi:hypothetical protein
MRALACALRLCFVSISVLLCLRACISLNACMCVRAQVFACLRAYVSVRARACMHEFQCVYVCACLYVCVRARAPSTCVHACAHAIVRSCVGMDKFGFVLVFVGGCVVFVFVGRNAGGWVFSLSSSLTQMIGA